MDHSMHTAPQALSHAVALELIDAAGGSVPITAEFHYDPADPYAVTTIFLTASGEVRWTFGRDLLSDGLEEPTGDGDVHVWPCLGATRHAAVILELSSPNGEAMIQARSSDLRAFVAEMHRAVPPGAEPDQLRLDEVVAAILDEYYA